MADFLKPQSPLEYQNNYIYPLTTYDQIILPNNERWDGSLSQTKRINISVPANGWQNAEDGSATQVILIDNFTMNTICTVADLDASTLTKENYNEMNRAWACVDKIETVNGGILLTCFKSIPEIDFNLIIDIPTVIMTSLPNVNGVTF